MYRVLHIMAGADIGGISMVVLNYYRYIDRSRIQFGIAFTTDCSGQNADALRDLGAEIYQLPLKSKNMQAFERELQKLLKEKNFDAVHVHENETSYVALRIAKKMGIKQRIAHAHSAFPSVTMKQKLRKLSGNMLNYRYATCLIACGELAGDTVFGKKAMESAKAVLLPNAINIEKFFFEEGIREQVRTELGVTSHFVVGMIGRLSKEKNHQYALQIIKKFHDIVPEVKLLIAGNGDDEDFIRECIAKNNMEEYVCLLGKRDDVEKLYQAFDVFILPSLYEGFPVVAVEALSNGLPVLLSTRITQELKCFETVKYIDLENEEEWIKALKEISEDPKRADCKIMLREKCLDIHDASRKLEQIYLCQ